MCENLVITILTVFFIIQISEQSCDYYCNANKNNYCTENIKANASVKNAINGQIDFRFQFKCNVLKYIIELHYNDTVNESDCVSNNSFKYAHSEYVYSINPSETNNINNKNKICEESGNVVFENIKTGCYNIIIIDQNKYILDEAFFWKTNYSKHFDVKKTNTSYGFRNNGTELKLHIENPVFYNDPTFSLKFNYNNNSDDTEYKLIPDKNDIKKLESDQNNTLKISCDYNAKSGAVDCLISPAKIGEYKITITYFGNADKCRMNTFPKNEIKVLNINVDADDVITQKPMENMQMNSTLGIILGIICSIISFYLLIVLIKLVKNKKHKFENTSNLICEIKVDTKCTNLLLLYARNSENVMKTLSSFRNLFTHFGINVYDIYDPEKLKDINENNYNWILNLTSRKDVFIIIFLTPGGESLSNLPKTQESVDDLYPFAIKQLHNKISNDYDFNNRIFVAYFENDKNEYSDYEIFSPNLRFSVPGNIQALIQRILNEENISFNNKLNNKYNRFLENYDKQLIV